MDGKRLEGQLSHAYSVADSEQSDHHAQYYLRHRPRQWLRWVLAVVLIHAALVAVLWCSVWHVSDEQSVMVIELVSSGAQGGGAMSTALTQQDTGAQVNAAQDAARPDTPSQTPATKPEPAQPQPQAQAKPEKARISTSAVPRELDPYSSVDPATVNEPASENKADAVADKSEPPQAATVAPQAKPDVPNAKPVAPQAKPVAPQAKPVVPKATPVPPKTATPTDVASTSSSNQPSQQSGPSASLQAGEGKADSASAVTAGMGADRLPSILSSPKPPYPREAFRARQEGRVTVDIEVLSDGKVGRTALNATSGVPSLDASALEAIRNWQYAPGTKGGKLSPQWIRVVVSFELKNR